MVRRIVGIREGRPLFSDALGELVELTETASHAGHRAGHAAGTAGARCTGPSGCRRPPAAPPPTWSRWSWPPTRPGRRRYAGRLGDWLLRAAEGWTGRANSALPVGDPDRPLAAAIDAVERWYADRGPAAADQHAAAARRAGRRRAGRPRLDGPPADAGADRAAAAAWPPPRPADAGTCRRSSSPTAPVDDWLAIAAGRKGGLPDAARHVLTAVDQVRFAARVRRRRRPAGDRAAARSTGQGRWLGLSLIEVAAGGPPAGAGPARDRARWRSGAPRRGATRRVPPGRAAQHGGGRALPAARLHHPPHLPDPGRPDAAALTPAGG